MSGKSSPSTTPIPRKTPLPYDPPSPTSAHRVRSPLNSTNTSPKSLVPESKSSPPRIRLPTAPVASGNTLDQHVEESSEGLRPLAMTLADSDKVISLPEMNVDEDRMESTFRDRSRSPPRRDRSKDHQIAETESLHPEIPEGKSLASSWWGPERHVPRSWQSEPKRQRTVPEEQALALEETRKTVAKAVVSVLGTTADIIHETLVVGVELLEFAPIPGLAIAAKTLVNIWDSAQNVDMNRLACLRLTERCADILISIREEIHDAGDQVGAELAAPISKLEETYVNVYRFMHKQKNRPWLKRYLKREEIQRDIAGCDNMLRDALNLFGVSIQIRILRQVQESEKRRQSETRNVLQALLQLEGNNLPPNSGIRYIMESETQVTSPEHSPDHSRSAFVTQSTTDFSTTKSALGLIDAELNTPTGTSPSGIIAALERVHWAQNNEDAARDTSDLRQLMRTALATNSDKDMLEVLQIARQEMPDAIKALQRARERITERGSQSMTSSVQSLDSDIVSGSITRRVSVREVEGDSTSGTTTLQRSETIVSIDSSSSSGDGIGTGTFATRDTLDQEFLEMGIDCLTRMTGAQGAVPNWTITKFEIDREDKIGVGFFSDVYKGSWNGQVVAIKVLAETTPRKLFLREIGIWKTLTHPNVLPLYGASSASGDPPWFFVSPYIKNGNLVEHLKRVEQEYRPSGTGVGPNANQVSGPFHHHVRGSSVSLPGPWGGITESPHLSPPGNHLTPPATPIRRPLDDNSLPPREWDLFRFMHEIAKGMEYLHNNGVLHGDLKAANVLVDYRYRCLISDFGQSEMRSEAYRMSGKPAHHGTMRWQAPEFMSGKTAEMTPAADVWSFAISCVEILTMGRLPWPFTDDTAVRYFVLKEDSRPPLPKNSRFLTPRIQELLRFCWHTDPSQRYNFTKISRELKLLRKSYGQGITESPGPTMVELPQQVASPSPDLRPQELPQFIQGFDPIHPPDVIGDSFPSLRGNSESEDTPQQESTISMDGIKMPEPVIYTPASSRSSSVRVHRTKSKGHASVIPFHDGTVSPPVIDELSQQRKNERRYRMLLTHDFHPSLTLPLWSPSPVKIGAVGYHSKQSGSFVTLFNAFNPSASDHPGIQTLPSIYGYGVVQHGIQRLPQKTVAQKAIDMLIGSLTFRNTSENLIKRTSFPLKAGHPAAYLYTETTEYRYFETLDAPKKWFKIHADAIMSIYGYQENIHKEDLFLIIGTLQTPNYALMVSHQHPEGHAHFNVYSNPKPNRPWGTFTMDNEVSRSLGPAYDFDEPDERLRLSDCKVSEYNGPWHAVLLARLRFKTDSTEPTSK